ncbi:hypothetical protein AVEN_228636-1 [Araneus ventricosus]|uniref:Uncharacterized protein n=1 Tax=Araneus ventricosus TaxID=182803 RepID=A0A4Y2H042_ARAVE|nr:hypothetical protein AVEN_228636-1 [Araneus ventricosus]
MIRTEITYDPGGCSDEVSASRPEGSWLETRFHDRSVADVGMVTVKSDVDGKLPRSCGNEISRSSLSSAYGCEIRPNKAYVLLQNGL